MLNDEICKMRDKLNKSILDGKDYTIIYKISVELDELISKYYKQEVIIKKYKNRTRDINKYDARELSKYIKNA